MREPDYVCVFTSNSAGTIAVAQSLLEVERIEYFTKNWDSYDIGSYGGAGRAELWVRAADANESRIILKDLTEDGRPASG